MGAWLELEANAFSFSTTVLQKQQILLLLEMFKVIGKTVI